MRGMRASCALALPRRVYDSDLPVPQRRAKLLLNPRFMRNQITFWIFIPVLIIVTVLAVIVQMVAWKMGWL